MSLPDTDPGCGVRETSTHSIGDEALERRVAAVATNSTNPRPREVTLHRAEQSLTVGKNNSLSVSNSVSSMSLPDTDPGCGGRETSTHSIGDEALERRVAALATNSTNPIPKVVTPQRVEQSPTVEKYNTLSVSNGFSVFAIKEQDLLSDTRVVVCPPVSGEELEKFALPNATGQKVAIARQSSRTTYFTLNLGENRRCEFYYDISSDNVIAFNNGREVLHMLALKTDGKDDPIQSVTVSRQCVHPLSPGYWRIMSDRDGCASDSLTEFVLFRRKYITQKSSDITAGSKRPASDTDATKVAASKTQCNELQTQSEDNPIVDVRPATKLSVTSNDSNDTFTISNLRDIYKRTVTIVFRGHHSKFGDTVVKVIKTAHYSPEKHDIIGLVQSWKREVQFLEKPSIVKLLGSDGRFFTIFMEYLPFPDLTMKAKEPDYFFNGTVKDANRVLLDMASALKYLEERKLSHNDVKPGNIVYDRARGAVLIDFGLASEAGNCFDGGTPYYIPPEIKRRVRHQRSDVYALGITLLYLLKKIPLPGSTRPGWTVGRWDGKDVIGWYNEVAGCQRRLCKDGIEGIVARMLEVRPDARISPSGILRDL